MSSHLIYLGIDAIAAALTLIIAARFLQKAPRHKNSWFVLLISLGAACYVLSARQDYDYFIPAAFDVDFGALYPLMNLARNATAAFFMLLARSVFRDGAPAPKPVLLLFGLLLLLEEPLAWWLGPAWATAYPQWSIILNEVVPALIQLLFLALALYWIVSERDADLVIHRRRVRVAFLFIYIAQVVLALLVERVAMSLEIIPPAAQYPIHMALVVVGLITSLAILLSLMSDPSYMDTLLYKRNPHRPVPTDGSEDTDRHDREDAEADVGRILQALQQQHVYRTAGLSVGGLATLLSIPEYRLRALIHHHMGYRNFNALLHHYRVAEVADALADPARNAVPVLTLALSAGYQSINPFNRAFRAQHGMTPTEYRRNRQNNQVDSLNSTPESTNAPELQ